MSGSITDFLATFSKTGIAKSSHFDVMLLPLGAIGQAKIHPSLLTFRCEAAEIPGRQLVTADQKIYGPTYKTPYQNLYAETNLTFVETGDMDIRVFFEGWMDAIWNSETNTLAYPDEYKQDITVNQYDLVATSNDSTDLRKTMSCTLIEAFPTNINQMITAWADDSFHRVQVTFAYRRYTITHYAQIAKEKPIIVADNPNLNDDVLANVGDA